MITVSISVSGRVQGVGFRNFVRRNAESLNVKGWVKNTTDNQVESVFQGSPDDVNELVNRCREGPSRSEVEKIEIKEIENKESFKDFQIRY